jgi:hypothetical protein
MSKRKKQSFRISLYWEETGGLKEGAMEDCRDVVIARKPSEEEMDLMEIASTISAAKLGLVSQEDLGLAVTHLKLIEKKYRNKKNRTLFWESMRLLAEGVRALSECEIRTCTFRSTCR